jgi:hypothetical protein
VNYIRPGIGATCTELKRLCLDCYALQTDEERHWIGAYLASSRLEFGRQRWRAGGADIGYDESLEIVARCWKSISSDNVKKAWNVV